MSAFRTIWTTEDRFVEVIDQRKLPHEWVVVKLLTYKDAEVAIKDMTVRGAPLIGATAAYGIYLAVREMVEQGLDGSFLDQAFTDLRASRPTAVNLFWALDKMRAALDNTTDFLQTSWEAAGAIVEEDVETCRMIGVHGLPILEAISERKNGETINILTHCNAGMLGCIEWGTITSPIYQAVQKGLNVHVWVDETRPRNQGANLTCYELTRHNVPHTLIVDNTGGHLMQHGMVDMVIVGTDRTTRQGDVANKIGTYLKALAANDNKIPFYVALPSTTLDWTINDGLKEIPIEERNQDEVKYVIGKSKTTGKLDEVLICPETTKASNYGFDVTPARLVTGLITERGVCEASEEGLLGLFPEKK
ncbi:MAG: S-methyl-5-thioribose-1-phosphate isomerase [Candidatus Fluviicola riflensis]|nr:MAG: S-methyl-5-thioribose-1-phosphate isomerase [Candidatus Fluviicola riflensis]OGS76646.1 MAG: S-methyl-5-thioribose-1-phosphate isomerase [Candidatus Fluviicola riflensis]OGS82999.1 MAG: S-methyl-5-thioribose-1-phosphate isomerase [Fluviicola sp. RIFCSPHIGHO2_01_FULL_43_53]OGS88377.1 MAG: S-methyl-5-thioribose-1-phosphate isomerase [Fluviicola sp. RIFCSPHIGHO2_12_FULL_43_24]